MTANDVIGDLVGPRDPNYDISGSVDNENIYRRNGGCGVVAEDKLYVWGGEGAEERQLELDSDEEEFTLTKDEGIWCVTVLPPPRFTDHPFDVFDLHKCTWNRQRTTGDVPLLGLGSSLNYQSESRMIYLFGGWNYGNFDSEVYQITLDEWKWIKVDIVGSIKPIGRYMTGTLIHENRLCTIGGAGLDINTRSQDRGARYEQTYFKGAGFGRNNEYYEFDMITKEWSVPLGEYSERPDPLSGPCFVKFDQHRAILFGGGYKDGRRNETRIFNLTDQTFTAPLKFSGHIPCRRAFTTFTPLIDPCSLQVGCGVSVRQKILLLWGKKDDNLLTDSWILDIDLNNNQFSWVQVDINSFARGWHIAGPLYYHNSSECRIALFGGNVHWNGFVGRRRNIGDVRLLQFGVSSLSVLCARVLAKNCISICRNILSPHSFTNTLVERAHATITNAGLFLSVGTHSLYHTTSHNET